MIYLPDINPIRFFQNRDWDYNSDFPTETNLPSSISDDDVGTVIFNQQWAINNEIAFQILHTTTNVEVYVVIDDETETLLNGTDVTPQNWGGMGNRVMLYKYKPAISQVIYFKIKDEVSPDNFEEYRSDCIKVEDSLPDCKRVAYYHDSNEYNAVFIKDDIRVFFPVIFIKARTNKPLIGNTYSISKTPSGLIRKLQSSPVKGVVFESEIVPAAIVHKLQLILSCSFISVNGIVMQNETPPSLNNLEGSNGNLINIELFYTNWNYTGDYFPIYILTPPDCGIEDDIQWWFKKSGSIYIDQYTGYTLTEVNGRIDFVTEPEFLINQEFKDAVEIFNRNNSTIQKDASREADDFDSSNPYSYAVEDIVQIKASGDKSITDYYNNGYMGRLYIKGNADEIIVYKTDKTLDCDKTILEYIGENDFVIDEIDSQIILEFDKYNMITKK